MTVYTNMIEPDVDRPGSAGGANVKAWIDGLGLTTINHLAVTNYGRFVLVIVEGT